VKWPKVTGLDMLKHLLAEHDLGRRILSRLLAAAANLGAMILRGERNLTHSRTSANSPRILKSARIVI